MRRLIVKLSSIGDVVHTLPALRALRAMAPSDFIAWVVEEPAYPLLERLAGLDELILLPRRRWQARWSTAREAPGLFARIRGMRFDQVIDFQGLARSGLVAALSGAPERVGFADGRELSPIIYNRRVRVERGARHAVDRNLGLVRALGAPAGTFEAGLSIPGEAAARVRRLVREEGLSEGFVILHPSAGRATNRYPPDRFAEVGDRVVREMGLGVAVTGSASDREIARQVVGAMREPAADLSGRLDLWGMAALSASSRGLVGGDTGPLHLAVAIGTPVVAIYGGASPEKTGPYGGPSLVVRSPRPCGPCYRRSCPDLPCMAAISPEEVFGQVRRLTGSLGPQGRAVAAGRGGEGGGWR